MTEDVHPIGEVERKRRIAALNDRVRSRLGLGMEHSRVVMTEGISALGKMDLVRVCAKVREFSSFTEDNDPYHEHDFGSFDLDGQTIMWKFDYYNDDLTEGKDPLDEDTMRVLTIMLSSEY